MSEPRHMPCKIIDSTTARATTGNGVAAAQTHRCACWRVVLKGNGQPAQIRCTQWQHLLPQLFQYLLISVAARSDSDIIYRQLSQQVGPDHERVAIPASGRRISSATSSKSSICCVLVLSYSIQLRAILLSTSGSTCACSSELHSSSIACCNAMK
jgi:hypothetical protein